MFRMTFQQPGKIEEQAIRLALLHVVEKEAKECKAILEQTVNGWNNPPKFVAKRGGVSRARGADISATVELSGDEEAIKHWNWVEQGVAEHTIGPRPENKTGRLHYQRDFRAKTHQGSFSSTKSGGKSGEWIHPRVVKWIPREQGRKWRTQLHKERYHIFARNVQNALATSLRNQVSKANASSHKVG